MIDMDEYFHSDRNRQAQLTFELKVQANGKIHHFIHKANTNTTNSIQLSVNCRIYGHLDIGDIFCS